MDKLVDLLFCRTKRNKEIKKMKFKERIFSVDGLRASDKNHQHQLFSYMAHWDYRKIVLNGECVHATRDDEKHHRMLYKLARKNKLMEIND